MEQNRFHYVMSVLLLVLVLPFNAWMPPSNEASKLYVQPQINIQKQDMAKTERVFCVIPLDHAGLATGRELPVSEDQFHLDTGRDRAVWYWVKFET